MTQSGVRSRRDAGVTAMIFGFFANAWFGWAQASPPSWLVPLLYAGTTVGLILLVVGAVVGFRAPGDTSTLRRPGAFRRYGTILGVEFAMAGLGGGLIAAFAPADYIAAWIAAVVGVHFFPLATVLLDRSLMVLGALLTLLAVVGLVAALVSAVAVTTIVGTGAGILLVAFAMASLLRR